MPNIKLESSDEIIFTVDVDVMNCSNVIKLMLEHLGIDEDEEEVIPLPNVNSWTLEKIISWAEHHKSDILLPEGGDNDEQRTDNISNWDKEFVDVNQGTLYELIIAANYLDIKGLVELICKTIANMIKGKTAEEIRATFNIENDFTPSEQEALKLERPLCEED